MVVVDVEAADQEAEALADGLSSAHIGLGGVSGALNANLVSVLQSK